MDATQCDDTHGGRTPSSVTDLQWPRDRSINPMTMASPLTSAPSAFGFAPIVALGLGPAALRWILFWVLGLLQLGGYALYSRLNFLPSVQRIFSTPYRTARIGERFYGTRHHSSSRGVAFWIVLAATPLLAATCWRVIPRLPRQSRTRAAIRSRYLSTSIVPAPTDP